MSEKSSKKGFRKKKNQIDNSKVEPKKRGRPKGSKNNPKPSPVKIDEVVVKKRGRPKGSKNKPKQQKIIEPVAAYKPTVTRKKKPVGIEEKTSPKTKIPDNTDPVEHPLFVAAKWLEKKMHPSEMQHYRSRSTRNGISIQHAIVADLFGFFNIQDPELSKQIKKNNFIASISRTNELHH